LGLGFVCLGVAILIGLGVWQLQRRAQNALMLSRVADLAGAPAQPLNAVLNRLGRRPADLDFKRVQVDCPTLLQTPAVRLYTLSDAGPGWRIVTACPLASGPYGAVLVDRGVVAQDAAPAKPLATAIRQPVVGVLRHAPPPNFADPKHVAGANDWYGRDLPAMAKALGAPNPLPLFLILESPSAGPDGPKPMPLPVEVRDNLQYALTWFGLAAALVGVYIATQIARRRKA
jgi:surfeit locus 1 family protein